MQPESALNRNPLQRLPLIYLCFFVSGAAGLMYEIIWARILGLTFGHTVYAVTTVLAAFMGGLALGSWYFGKVADRISRPLVLYALLEIGIGLYCLVIPFLLTLVREIYPSFFGSVPGGVPVRTLLQFTLAFLVLIIPTTLMGGTLPAVCRALVDRPPDAGRKVGLLYGVNTIGAALGAFAVGYWLLPSIGVKATNHLGVAVNLFAGAAVLLFFSRDTIGSPPANGAISTVPHGREPLDTLLLWSFAISGAVGMSYQIVWVRALILVIGSSTYAFSAILVTFLLGISLGGFLFSRLHRRNGFRFFAILQFGIALAAFALIPIFDGLPGLLFSLFQGFTGPFRYILFSQFLIVFTVVLLPATLMGMTFPCITGLLTRRMASFGGDLGRFYAYNTGGAIAGSLLTGFFLLPFLGVQGTLAIGIGLNGLMGAAVLFLTEPAKKKVLAFLILPICLASVFFPKWDRRIMASGVFYLGQRAPSLKDLTSSHVKEILFFREGVSSTITVARNPHGILALLVNGKVDASNGDDMETQNRCHRAGTGRGGGIELFRAGKPESA
jgi:spermidine synthase